VKNIVHPDTSIPFYYLGEYSDCLLLWYSASLLDIVFESLVGTIIGYYIITVGISYNIIGMQYIGMVSNL
jgi:hypothetical protein